MVLIGATSGAALASLGSIDRWITTLNSSIAGSARTGYKNSQVTFGGGTTRLERPVVNGALGIQYAEQSLNIGSTNIDFSQGQVVASTQYTHLALSGSQNAFFVYADSTNLTAATTRFYYSRDGETHRDQNGNLVNANGLFLVGLDNTNTRTVVNIPMTDQDPEGTMNGIIDSHNLNLTGANVRLAHAFVNDLSSLKYSKYGGTILENNTPTTFPATFRSADAATGSGGVRITGSALEASNVQLPSTTVELSLAQKIYNALTKVIQVDQEKITSILNLIR